MLHIFVTAVNAVMPIVLLILAGWWLRRVDLINEGFVKTGNTLVFKVCLPCMLFVNVYEIESVTDIPWNTVIYCAAAITVLFLLGMAVAVLTTKAPNRRGVIWQCCFRSNYAIIGIPLSSALGGEAAAAVTAIATTLVVPLFNMLAVIALSVFSGEGAQKPKPGKVLRDIFKNPLIVAVMAGLVCLGLRALQRSLFGEVLFSLSRDMTFVYSAVEKLKTVATPLALLAMGGQFQFSVVRGMLREIAVAAVFRLLAAPALGIGMALILEKAWGLVSCGPDTMPAMIALFGTPVAISSAVMASQMKGDEQLATQLVVWTSIGSVVTVFALVCVLMAAGLLVV